MRVMKFKLTGQIWAVLSYYLESVRYQKYIGLIKSIPTIDTISSDTIPIYLFLIPD